MFKLMSVVSLVLALILAVVLSPTKMWVGAWGGGKKLARKGYSFTVRPSSVGGWIKSKLTTIDESSPKG